MRSLQIRGLLSIGSKLDFIWVFEISPVLKMSPPVLAKLRNSKKNQLSEEVIESFSELRKSLVIKNSGKHAYECPLQNLQI